MTTPSSNTSADLTSFIEEAIGDADLRIDHEFGRGFVRLKTSEAEKRQAAQDIRSSEDVVIEMLRNARDAGAKNIFFATQRSANVRSIVVIDDGCGIPEDMHERVFEPRVTSKLDTANMDRWGLHGRGMALYSIQVNARSAEVLDSAPEQGSVLRVIVDMEHLTEKKDQSTFPHFEMAEDATLAMRGPKNILRTAAEFALEHRDAVNVYCGTATEIAAALAAFGAATVSPAARAFASSRTDAKPVQRLAFAADPTDFSHLAEGIGLELSPRSARRIMDGQIAPPATLMERIKGAMPHRASSASKHNARQRRAPSPCKLARQDITAFTEDVAAAFNEIAQKYFLEADVEVTARVTDGVLRVDIPLVEER